MTLGELQELFVVLETQWVQHVLSLGYKLRHSEGRIFEHGPDGTGRKAFCPSLGLMVLVYDRVHKSGGAHYNGVGADWVLVVDGGIPKDGAAPAWVVVGEFWESLHPLARWGGRWGDDNHISLEWQGVK